MSPSVSGGGAPPPDRMSRSTKAGSNPAEVTHNSRETSFGSEAVSKGFERLGVMVFREFADISEAGLWTPATRAQHTRAAKRYQTDLSDAEWRLIVAFLPEASSTGRQREWPMREIVNAIFHVLRGTPSIGVCQQRPRPGRLQVFKEKCYISDRIKIVGMLCATAITIASLLTYCSPYQSCIRANSKRYETTCANGVN